MRLVRGSCLGKQLTQVIVDAGHAEVGLAGEGLLHVEGPFHALSLHDDDGQPEFVGLVEAVDDLVA